MICLCKDNNYTQSWLLISTFDTIESIMQDYISYYNSPLGRIMLASDGIALSGLWFEGQKHFASTLGQDYKETDLTIFEQTRKWLDIYLSGRQPEFTPALNIRTSPFRQAVLGILLKIPYGTTITYGQIAAMLAKSSGIRTMSAQAVGGAIAYNPISLIIPCHRVVGSNGSLTGYAGGLERKIYLLELEQNKCIFVP